MIVADRDPLARGVVRRVLQDAGMLVVADADSGRGAIDLSRFYKPDILLMAARMPGIGGIAATRQILADSPRIRIVLLGLATDDELAVASLRAGASGFLTKEIDLLGLPRALKAASGGEIACSRHFVGALVAQLRSTPDHGVGTRPVKSVLTPREWEVLDLLCVGANTRAVADALVLSNETIRTHVKNILRKLEVSSRKEAIARVPELRRARFETNGYRNTNGHVSPVAAAR